MITHRNSEHLKSINRFCHCARHEINVKMFVFANMKKGCQVFATKATQWLVKSCPKIAQGDFLSRAAKFSTEFVLIGVFWGCCSAKIVRMGI